MIIFKTVRWKNLLSSGNNFTEMRLDEHQTTLILGENGSGKSTLLDAMCFGLYGRGFRNLKKELLINSVNEKGLLVEIEFSIGKREYKVIRGAKPNKFEIYVDNVFVNQDATVRDYQEHLEKNILKMSHRSFTQVAILGSANFVPFMQLKAKDRRNLVEDLLDISIFSTMSDLLRKRVSTHTVELRETHHEINIMEERIQGLTSQLNALRENREQKIGKFESTITETDNNIEVLLSRVDKKNELIKDKTSSISDRDPQGDRLKQAKNLSSKLEDKKHIVIREIAFYEDNDNCPTCKQDLDEEHKATHLAEKQSKKDELVTALDQIERTITDSANRMEEIKRVQEGIASLQSQISVLQTEIISNQKYISKLNKEIEDIKSEATVNNNAQDQIDTN
jgi:DNA repair exonuclease SbcCD ATPase subunit